MYRNSTTNSGQGSSMSTAVPSGTAINDIIILGFGVDDVTAGTLTWPGGFTQLDSTRTPSADGQTAAIAWKRATASESGSYTVSGSAIGASDWVCQAAVFSARDAVNPPTASGAANNTANASPVSINAGTVTALAGDDLCWISMPDVTASGVGNGHTPPTGYTERQDFENLWANMSIATLDNSPAGATGTVTGTFALTGSGAGWAVFLVRIPAGKLPVPTIVRQAVKRSYHY